MRTIWMMIHWAGWNGTAFFKILLTEHLWQFLRKMIHLQSLLTSKAKGPVHGYGCNSDLYASALNCLQEHLGNAKQFVTAFLEKLYRSKLPNLIGPNCPICSIQRAKHNSHLPWWMFFSNKNPFTTFTQLQTWMWRSQIPYVSSWTIFCQKRISSNHLQRYSLTAFWTTPKHVDIETLATKVLNQAMHKTPRKILRAYKTTHQLELEGKIININN